MVTQPPGLVESAICFHGSVELVFFLVRVARWPDLKQFVILLKLLASLGSVLKYILDA